MGNGTVKYDPKTGQFHALVGRQEHVRLGSGRQRLVHAEERRADQDRHQQRSAEADGLPLPKNKGIYDIDTDSKGRTDLYIWRDGKIGIFDPKTVDYTEYQTPTPMSGPRRGQIDGQDRLWAAEFYAGQVLMFDPDKKVIKEFPLINGGQALHGALRGALLGQRR